MRTSSQPSNIAVTRAESARMLLTTDRCSMPTDASSATGLQIAGNPTLAISSPRRMCAQRGTGSPARSRTPLTTFLRSVSAVVQLGLPVNGMPRRSRTEITIASYTASPSMPSQRLKIRSNFPRRSRSTQRPSVLTGTRTTSVARSRRALSTASMESSSCTSGALPRAERPSNNNAIFIARSSACSKSCQSTGGKRRFAPSSGGLRDGASEIDSLPRGGVLQTTLNELFIAYSCRACGFRQTRIIRWVGKDSRQRIHFEHVWISCGIETNVDSRPVPATQNAEGVEGNSLNRRLKVARDTRRALENIERILRPIPNELGVEAVDRESSMRKRLEIHSNDREHCRAAVVAEYRAGELLSGKILLDENWLFVVIEEEFRLGAKVGGVSTKIPVGDAFRRSFVKGLRKKREPQTRGSRLDLIERGDHRKAWSRDSVKGQRLLRSCLVETKRERERIATGIGDSQKLADRRDMPLAIHSPESLGDVEDDIGPRLAEPLRKIFVRLEANHSSKLGQSRFNRRDRSRTVPLGEFIAGD